MYIQTYIYIYLNVCKMIIYISTKTIIKTSKPLFQQLASTIFF